MVGFLSLLGRRHGVGVKGDGAKGFALSLMGCSGQPCSELSTNAAVGQWFGRYRATPRCPTTPTLRFSAYTSCYALTIVQDIVRYFNFIFFGIVIKGCKKHNSRCVVCVVF